MDNRLAYTASTNPTLAVRLSGGPRFPHPGHPEKLVWKWEEGAVELAEAVYNAITGLPAKYQEVIEARYGEEVTLQAYGNRIGGRTRERVRQLEAAALRKMRLKLGGETLSALRQATQVVPIPGSALDPDWVGTQEAHEITGYTRDHVRWLCRMGKVLCQVNPLKRNQLQISKASLRTYVLADRGDRRKTGKWREEHEQA